LALALGLISAFPAHCTLIGAKTRFCRNLVKPSERVQNSQVIANTANIFIGNMAYLPYSISYHRSRWLEGLGGKSQQTNAIWKRAERAIIAPRRRIAQHAQILHPA
jgi:hypothetical protein